MHWVRGCRSARAAKVAIEQARNKLLVERGIRGIEDFPQHIDMSQSSRWDDEKRWASFMARVRKEIA